MPVLNYCSITLETTRSVSDELADYDPGYMSKKIGNLRMDKFDT